MHYSRSLVSVIIPDTVTTITTGFFASSKGAFEGCTSLASVTIPANASIDAYAFGGCTSLASVTIPASGLPAKQCTRNDGTHGGICDSAFVDTRCDDIPEEGMLATTPRAPRFAFASRAKQMWNYAGKVRLFTEYNNIIILLCRCHDIESTSESIERPFWYLSRARGRALGWVGNGSRHLPGSP